MTRRSKSFLKSFASTVGIVLLIQVLLSLSLFYVSYNERQHILEREVTNHFDSVEKRIQSEFSSAINDLSFLLKSFPFQNVTGSVSNYRRMATVFSSMIENTPSYDQLRYINGKGIEVVRVNKGAFGDAVVVKEASLQKKSHRYYFSESIKNPPGTLYVSRFDLNVESGVLEVPIKPTIRLAVVVEEVGGGKGVLVLNLLAYDFLNIIAERDHQGEYSLWFANSAGHFFKGPSPQYEWGFSYARRSGNTLIKFLPQEGKEVLSSTSDSGVISRGMHSVLYKRLNQVELLKKSNIHLFKNIVRSRYAKDWFLVSKISLGATGMRLISQYLQINLPVLFFVFLLSFYMGRRATKEFDLVERNTLDFKNSEKKVLSTVGHLQNAYHEIHAPLNGIMTVSSLFKDSKLTRYQSHLLRVLDSNSKILQDISRDIQGNGQIDKANIRSRSESFNLVDTVESVSEMAAVLALSKGIDFQSYIDPKLMHFWKGDSDLLKRLLVALLTDSINHTHVGNVFFKVKESEGYGVDFEVIDTGRPMGQYELNLYYSDSNIDPGSVERSLYGAAIVKELTSLFGGVISVKSDRNDGSVYSISLPLNKEEGKGRIIIPEIIKNRRFITIGLDSIVAEDLKHILNLIGGHVDIEDSTEALKTMKGSDSIIPFDVIFVDYQYINELEGLHQDLIEKVIIIAPLDAPIDERFVVATRPLRSGAILKAVESLPHFSHISGEIDHSILAVLTDQSDENTITHYYKKIANKIDIVSRGAAAIEKVSTSHYDIIFIDVDIKDINCKELVKGIREFDSEAPLVAISCYRDSEQRSNYLKMGMEYFLKSPVSTSEIARISDLIQSIHLSGIYAIQNFNHPAIFDYKELVESTGEDKEGVRVVLEAYMKRSNEIIDQVQTYLNKSPSHDLDFIAALMHELKGSSANISAMKLTGIVRDVEKKVKCADLEDIKTGVESIVAAKEELIQEIEKVL